MILSKSRPWRLCLNIILVGLLLPWWGRAGSPTANWQLKVDPAVLAAARQGETEFLVYLDEQADLAPAAGMSSKEERGQYVFQRLQETARRTQAPVIAVLERQGAEYRSFWIANLLWVRGDLAVVQAVAELSEVQRILANPEVQLDEPEPRLEQADLAPAAGMSSKEERGQYVFQRLQETARRTQAPVIAVLERQGAEYRSFWIANLLWVRGDLAVVQAVAELSEVQRILANPEVQLDASEPRLEQAAAAGQVEWNVQQVGAPQVWAEGFTGQGSVVAGQDTGYYWAHPALQGKYRGWNGVAADHNYNWHDAIHTDDPHTQPGNPCGFDATAPCDDFGHGTHTMGTMVGDDGSGNQIGVAPGARWIGCRNMEQGWGKPSTYIECFQWFVAPTDLSDQNPRPELAPDVINNSWSCPAAEGCSWDALQVVIDNVRQAGILVVVSAGNQGSDCGSIVDPPALYQSAFVVGAVNSLDRAASFSSRGPALHTNLTKPDVSAPGVSVRSSLPPNGYASNSGTSMAAPHVAGLAALALSAAPGLRGRVEELEQVIRATALPLTTTESCGSIPAGQVPNNTYGWGRVDAAAALKMLRIGITKTASAAAILPGETITYTLTLTNLLPITTTQVILTDTLPTEAKLLFATPPYHKNEDVFSWEVPLLGPNQSRSVELAIRLPKKFTGIVINNQYGAYSAELPHAAPVPPVVVLVGQRYYFPVISR